MLTESDTPSRHTAVVLTRRSFLSFITIHFVIYDGSLQVVLTRRSFLSFIPALFVRPRPLDERRGPLLLTTTVAGYRFHDGARIEHRLHEGDRLVLRREPNNPHDCRAVAVDHPAGLCIGYLPRRCNEIPSRLLDQRVAICAENVRIAPPPAEPWKRVEVAIRLAGANRQP